jgi:putative peptidoglycan lipid II flippase
MGLAGFSTSRIAAQAFYAMGAAGTAVKLGLLSVVVNSVAAVALMGPLAHGGLALASSIGAYVNVALLLWVARRHFGRLGGRALAASLGRTLAASLPVGLWCGLCVRLWPVAAGRGVEAAWLAGAVGVGAAIFALGSRIVAAPEYAALRGMLPTRRPR